MRKTIMSLGIVFSVLFVGTAMGQIAGGEDVSGADFLPPVQGGDETVEKPDQVKVTGDVVQAASAQDAMNAAVKENVKAIKGDPEQADETPEIGAKWLKFGSGVGILATGMGTYEHMPNPTATRQSQRDAYVVAFYNAKAAMARTCSEISVEGRTVLETAMSQMNTAERVENANSTQLEEILKQSSDALIKGFVTFSIKEIPDEVDPSVRFVYVSIASTPKTQTLVTRSGAVHSVDKLIDGLNEMLRDIKKGLVPPVGGRVITVPKTKQTAFVGFGSSVVSTSRNRAMLAKMKLNARKIAAARARDALFGMIGGDRVLWRTGIHSGTAKESKEIMTYAKKDPLALGAAEVEETLQEYSSAYESNEQLQETIQAVRKGILPPGVQEKTWIGQDGHWVYSMMVYYPPLSNFAAATSRKIREAKLIAPVDDGGITAGGKSGVAGKGRPGDNSKTRTIDGTVKPLKGGKVAPKEDL